MAIGSGLAASLAFGLETTYGVAATLGKAIPLLSESLSQQIDRIQSQGIIPGNRTWRSDQWAPGNKTVGGDTGVELYDHGLGVLFRAMMGNAVTTGTAAPFTHTFEPGDLANDSLTVQVGKPATSGTVHPFTYLGCQVASWELACAQGEIATLGLTLAAREESRAIALATPAIPAALRPLSFNHGTLSIGGVAVANVRSATVAGDNGLDIERRFFNAAGLIAQPIQTELANFTATLESEFTDLTAYDRFVNGTEAALSLKFTLGANSVEIVGNVRTDGETPQVGGKAILTNSTVVTFMGPTTDASAIKIVAVNQDASL
jgi:hypothetical protein